MKLKVENRTILIWCVALALTLLILSVMTLVMSFPQTVSLARVFGAILLLSFITFLSEEGRRLKRMGKYIFRNIGAILVIIIMLATLVMGIYMLVTATIPTGGKWLLSIIFFLNAIVIGRALVT